MFVKELSSLDVPQPLSRYAPQTYDAVWAIALALRGAEEKWKNVSTVQSKLDGFDYTRYDMALEFLHQFSRLNFLGVSVSMNLRKVTQTFLFFIFNYVVHHIFTNIQICSNVSSTERNQISVHPNMWCTQSTKTTNSRICFLFLPYF